MHDEVSRYVMSGCAGGGGGSPLSRDRIDLGFRVIASVWSPAYFTRFQSVVHFYIASTVELP